eukprot:CAMPEP_0170490442 /NCGR_PEP_ID=MMETSP0208-20121228/8622_1 /TAXON_ID=197538 /ORGANISM="Strombidium inclinatum, Strain S3" /LENGTH=78 /DNA_ID=CAMNT_0010765813 /DNA_START=726 /DNA_END=962 /DNA_ORIENTATION=+
MQNVGIGRPADPAPQQQPQYQNQGADIEVANNQYGNNQNTAENHYPNVQNAQYAGDAKAEKIDVESVELEDPYAAANQ